MAFWEDGPQAKPHQNFWERLGSEATSPLRAVWRGVFGTGATGARADLRALFSPMTYVHGASSIVRSIPQTRFSWKLGFYTPSTKAEVEKVQRSAKGFAGFDLGAAARGIEASRTPATMFPGVQTVAWSSAKEDHKQFGKHPVLTALDLMPFATKAVGGLVETGAAEEARTAALAGGATEEEAAKVAQAVAKRAATHPWRTLARQASGAVGDWAESHPGEGPLSFSRLVTAARTGPRREFVRRYGSAGLFQRKADFQIATLSRELNRVQREFESKGLALERQEQLARMAEVGAPGFMQTLSPLESAFVHRMDSYAGHFGNIGVESGKLVDINGERFTEAQARAIKRLEQRASRYRSRAESIRQRLAEVPSDIAEHLKVRGGMQRYYQNAERLSRAIDDAIFSGKGKGVIRDLIKRENDAFLRIEQVEKAHGFSSELRDQFRSQLKLRTEAARLERLADSTGQRTRRIVPARWIQNPVIGDRIAEAVKIASTEAHPEAFAEIDRHILSRNYEALRAGGLIGDSELRQIAREQAEYWTVLKNKGFDPHFIHHVGVEKAERTLMSPRFRPDMLKTPSSLLERTWFGQTYEKNPWVAISAQGADYLQRSLTANALDDMIEHQFLETRDALVRRMTKMAEDGMGKGATVAERIDDLITRDHAPFDPSAIFPGARSGGMLPKGEQYWIPKTLEHTIASIQKSMDVTKLQRVESGITKAYAFSVLKLSPRYYVHVALSSTIALMFRTDPRVLTEARNAYRIMRDGNLEGLLPGGGFVTAEEAATALYHTAAGGTIGRLLSKFDGTLGKYSTFVHDMTQAMGYLYGEKHMLEDLKRSGVDVETDLSKQMAREAGVEIARRLVPQWDSFTPFERTVMRTAFPFYGFSSFLMRYVLSYPFDHPMRAFFMSRLAQKELDDWNTGIPTEYLSFLFIGKPDAKGQQMALPFTSAMPMLSVANMFTFSGIYARLHPTIQAGLQSAFGIDPNSGTPDLFPQLGVDDQGHFIYQHKENPVQSLAEQVVPQFQTVEQILGWNQNFKKLKETDPKYWRQLLYSNLGITTPSKLDLPAIEAKYRQRTGQQTSSPSGGGFW